MSRAIEEKVLVISVVKEFINQDITILFLFSRFWTQNLQAVEELLHELGTHLFLCHKFTSWLIATIEVNKKSVLVTIGPQKEAMAWRSNLWTSNASDM